MKILILLMKIKLNYLKINNMKKKVYLACNFIKEKREEVLRKQYGEFLKMEREIRKNKYSLYTY